MATTTKKMKAASAKIQPGKLYNLEEASALVKEVSTTKFDGSVDLAVRLGVDPRKANQMVRGTVSLPHGTGKTIRVLALVTPDKEAEAKEAGADFVGMDDYLEKIKNEITDEYNLVREMQVEEQNERDRQKFLMPESERQELIAALKKKWEVVHIEFQKETHHRKLDTDIRAGSAGRQHHLLAAFIATAPSQVAPVSVFQ